MTPDASEYRRPESVLIVVHTDNEALLLRRKAPFEFWQSVTGSLLPQESHAAAAARELREETGLSDEGRLSCTGVSRRFEIDPRWRNRFGSGVTDNLEYEYRYKLPGRVEISLDEYEHTAMEWVTLVDALDRVWSWTNKAALRQLLVL